MSFAGHDLFDPFVDGAGAHESVGDDGLGLSDAPRAVACLILDCRIPPAVIKDHVVGIGEGESGASRLQREHEGAGTFKGLELGDERITGTSGESTVVAADRDLETSAEMRGEFLTPFGEVGEHERPFAGRIDLFDDLLEAGQFPGRPSSGPSSFR